MKLSNHQKSFSFNYYGGGTPKARKGRKTRTNIIFRNEDFGSKLDNDV